MALLTLKLVKFPAQKVAVFHTVLLARSVKALPVGEVSPSMSKSGNQGTERKLAEILNEHPTHTTSRLSASNTAGSLPSTSWRRQSAQLVLIASTSGSAWSWDGHCSHRVNMVLGGKPWAVCQLYWCARFLPSRGGGTDLLLHVSVLGTCLRWKWKPGAGTGQSGTAAAPGPGQAWKRPWHWPRCGAVRAR